jgi:hypothetical protein
MIIAGGDSVEVWGLIPYFLDENDPRGAKEQFADKYVGGWSPFEGFKLDTRNMELSYSDDPPMKPISVLLWNAPEGKRRPEMVFLYESSWVMVIDPSTETWEVSRMD